MGDELPKDPVILLSYVNTQLRDHYENLQEFCKAAMVSKEEIEQKLKGLDYTYDRKTNQFI